jgi:hypothetical protein
MEGPGPGSGIRGELEVQHRRKVPHKAHIVVKPLVVRQGGVQTILHRPGGIPILLFPGVLKREPEQPQPKPVGPPAVYTNIKVKKNIQISPSE